MKKHMPGLRLRLLLRISVLLLLLSSYYSMSAQDKDLGAHSYSLAYYGNNFWNPGLKGGADYFLFSKEGVKKTQIKHALFAGGNMGFYIDPGSHTALFANVGLTYVRNYNNFWNFRIECNPAGIYRSMLGESFEVGEDGIRKLSFAGRTYPAPEIAFGMGKISDEGGGWYTQLSLITLLNYNTYIMPLLNLELGWKFKHISRRI